MKEKKLLQWWLLLHLLIATGAIAQPRQFSLNEAQQYAIENSYVLKNSRLDIELAQKEVWKTITRGLPQVDGTANYNMYLNLPVSLIPGEFFGEEPGSYIPVKFGQDYNADYGFKVNQLIFDGAYIVGVGSSKIYLNLAKHAAEKIETDLREAVAQAYYLTLIGIKNKQIMENNLANTQKLLIETEAYFKNGFREELDVDQMKILVSTAENEVLKSEREITIAKVVLKYTLGYPLDQEIELTDQLEDFINPLIKVSQPSEINVSEHIDFRLAVTNYQASEKLLKLEKAAFLPKLSGFYSYTKISYGNQANLLKSSVSWFPASLIGLQLTVPIFNSGQKILSVNQTKIEMEKALNNRNLAETTLQKDYLTAVAEFQSAKEKYSNDIENYQLAERILDKTKIKFSNGISSSTELSQIESQYLDSYGAYIASLMQLLQADIQMRKARGTL